MRTQAKPSLLTVITLVFVSQGAQAFVEFDDVTQPSGVLHFSKSYGACWGDVNGDGWLDLYANNHQEEPTLFINQRNGTFVNDTSLLGFGASIPVADSHGCAWGDLDGDGDHDMLELSGGNGGGESWGSMENRLYINDQGALTERAADYGVTFPEGRSRTPLLFDFNNDGLLDAVLTTLSREDGLAPNTVIRNEWTAFSDVGADVGFRFNSSTAFAQLSDLSRDGKPDIVAWRSSPDKWAIYDVDENGFSDISSSVLAWRMATTDAAIADFNNDLYPDVYFAYSLGGQSEVAVVNGNTLHASLITSTTTKYLSVAFTSQGVVDFEMVAPWFKLSDVSIGSGSYHPVFWNVSLDPDDPNNQGKPVFQAGVTKGAFVWFDTVSMKWNIAISSPNPIPGAADSLNVRASAASTLALNEVVGVNLNPSFPKDLVYLSSPTGIASQSTTWLADVAPCSSQGVVSGDFDNDMDVDLFVVCSRLTSNYPDVFLENVGNKFVPIYDAFPTQATQDGVGDNAVVADYDQDGFLDLYVMNGQGEMPFAHGTHQLLRNKGNGNHWLELDLVGVNSNKNGVGAIVYVTAGGKTQVREQSGGTHRYQQNTHRLHFGLGANSVATELRIRWPSGIEQTINNVGADKLLKIYEGVQPEEGLAVNLRPFRASGVTVSRTSLDQPYTLSIKGSGNGDVYEIFGVSNGPLRASHEFPLLDSAGESIEVWNKGFRAVVVADLDPKDLFINLPVDSRLMLSVHRNGRPALDSVVIGGKEDEAVPLGWIRRASDFPTFPGIELGKSHGVFAGRSLDALAVRWSSTAGKQTHTGLIFCGASAISAKQSSIEKDDLVVSFDNGILYSGSVGAGWWDGVDLVPQSFDAPCAVFNLANVEKDRQINPGDEGHLGVPNGTLLPGKTAFGEPAIAQENGNGLYVWKDGAGDWHFRALSGSGAKTFKGTLTSDGPLQILSKTSVEANDVLSVNPDGSVSFELKVSAPWKDEFSIGVSLGATVSLSLVGAGPSLPVILGVDQTAVTASDIWLGGPGADLVFPY